MSRDQFTVCDAGYTMVNPRHLAATFVLILAPVIVAGCSTGLKHGAIPRQSVLPPTPESVSPGSITPAPMAKTVILSASAMASAGSITTKSAIQGLNFSRIQGSAGFAAAAPDGSLWVLSDAPAGPDKYIWHYGNGSWINISGLASRLSVGPTGTVYAVNSGGGAFAYSSGSWTALGGGCRDLSAAPDGSLYVVSNGGGADGAIWRFAGSAWTQQPGSGNRIAASWDTAGPFSVSGGSVRSGGFYILNSLGSIWYENSDGSFAQLPGSASAIAPAKTGGVFVLGYPAGSADSAIFYFDLNAGSWGSQPGSGASISANGSSLYVVTSTGAIYATPIVAQTQVRIYVANFSSIDAYAATASGNAAPLATISGSNAGLWAPQSAALDTSGKIYVPNLTGGPTSNGSVTVYTAAANGNVNPVQTIQAASYLNDQTTLAGPKGIAVDAAGNIYVSNVGSTHQGIAIFAAGANGNAAPVRLISGINTGLTYPIGVALDNGNQVYVANYNNDSVTVYPAGANGNVAPLATIKGANTGLGGPWSLTVDAAGKIYVANVALNTLTVYAAGANGNSAPVATINGLNGPDGVALDAVGNIYVANSGNNTLAIYSPGASGFAQPTAVISGSSTRLNSPGGMAIH